MGHLTTVAKMTLKEFYDRKRLDYVDHQDPPQPIWPTWDQMVVSRGGLRYTPHQMGCADAAGNVTNNDKMALWMYTAERPDIYRKMNNALRVAHKWSDLGENG